MFKKMQGSFIPFAAVCLLAHAPLMHAQLPQLWPTFTTPTSVVNVNTYGTIASPDDVMAEATLIGAYNQLQNSTRLYLSNNYADDNWWLKQSVPSTISVTNLSWTQTDPDGALKALLSTYGSSISGYYICDPVNIPETCNMATTLAGIHQAMVVNPDNLSVMAGYTVPLLADVRTAYTWIGNNATLVNNTAINGVSNPSGGSGTTGWSLNGAASSTQTIASTTYGGSSALKWTVPASAGSDSWTEITPTVTAGGTQYVLSVQVAGTGTVYLDVWNGSQDIPSSAVTLTSSYQTLQLSMPIPLMNGSSNSTPQLEVRQHTSSSASTVYIANAAAVENAVAVDEYEYTNLISSTSTLALVQDWNDSWNLRDYAVAGKMFTFDLTSDDAAQKTLYGQIINHTAHNTPIFGYIPNESDDVAYLSGSGEGHFLNASDNYKNGSLWASLAQPSSLSQPSSPSAISITNGKFVHVTFSHVRRRQRILPAAPDAEPVYPESISGSCPGGMDRAARSDQFLAGDVELLLPVCSAEQRDHGWPRRCGLCHRDDRLRLEHIQYVDQRVHDRRTPQHGNQLADFFERCADLRNGCKCTACRVQDCVSVHSRNQLRRHGDRRPG